MVDGLVLGEEVRVCEAGCQSNKDIHLTYEGIRFGFTVAVYSIRP